MTPAFLAMEDIAKSYGGAHALRGVSLQLKAGEVHGLVGANGAGKSTLIRILAGLTQPDSGTILLDGQPVTITTPHRATELGMNFIHQELAFVPGMTVIENIMLGLPKRTRLGLIDWRGIARDVAPVAERVGITVPLLADAKGLSTAEHWLVCICRALIRNARLIVMDEPTASLSAHESEKLFAIIEGLSRSRVAVLYVSHRLDEVLRLCSCVTAFRDGRSIARIEKAGLTRSALVTAITGAHVEPVTKPATAVVHGQVALKVAGLARQPKVHGVTFDLHRGEVLGIGGLVGAGRSELTRLIFGADKPDAGSMVLDGAPFAPRRPAQAVEAGLGLVPEDRRTDGLLLAKSVSFNLLIANLARIVHASALPLIDDRHRRSLSQDIVRQLAIKAGSIETPVGRLSGGNQQKVLIGRWLLRAPKVLILDEPTRGVDIGARVEIHRLIRDLAAKGMAVLVVSSDPDELPDLCDRVLVMAEGRIGQELNGTAISRNAIVEASYVQPASQQGIDRMIDKTVAGRSWSLRTKASLGFFARYATIIGLAAMIAAFSLASPRAFPTISNFTNVLNQASLTMIIAAGLTLAVIVGELDLSIGFAASLHGILVTGLIVSNHLPIPVAILIVVVAGAVVGLINGLIVTKVKVNSVIATLGIGTILTGLAFAYSAGVPIVAGVPEEFLQLSLGRWLYGIPNNIFVTALVLGSLWLLVERTALGQEIQAVGGNPAAARLAGIDVDRIKILGLVISGMCAALTGILLASRLGSGTASAADSYLLTAFAAVFLGSATLRDGEFHVLGTLIGALIIAFGFNGLNIFGAPTFSQYVLQGAILIVAVGLSSLGRSISER